MGVISIRFHSPPIAFSDAVKKFRPKKIITSNASTAHAYTNDPAGSPLGNADATLDSYMLGEVYATVTVATTPGNAAKGRYKAHSKVFTERLTYIYKGEFVRAQSL